MRLDSVAGLHEGLVSTAVAALCQHQQDESSLQNQGGNPSTAALIPGP